MKRDRRACEGALASRRLRRASFTARYHPIRSGCVAPYTGHITWRWRASAWVLVRLTRRCRRARWARPERGSSDWTWEGRGRAMGRYGASMQEEDREVKCPSNHLGSRTAKTAKSHHVNSNSRRPSTKTCRVSHSPSARLSVSRRVGCTDGTQAVPQGCAAMDGHHSPLWERGGYRATSLGDEVHF